jgi:hypothetical protein
MAQQTLGELAAVESALRDVTDRLAHRLISTNQSSLTPFDYPILGMNFYRLILD